MKKYPRPPSDRQTEVFVNLPSGPITLGELHEALERVVSGVASWSDVRVCREAVEYVGVVVRRFH